MGNYYCGMMNNTYDRELRHHGILGQKWGVQNGPPYPINEEKLSKKIYSDAKSRVEQITKDVRSAARDAGSSLYGLDHRLKTIESIDRKIKKNSHEDGISLSESANNIKDAVRFTTISPENNYTDSYFKFKKAMEDKGYTETRCKNYFQLFSEGKVKHKSVQSTFASKDGYQFEVQFHTKASQNAKNKKIPLYEERRQEGVSKERASQLERQMEKLALNVRDPADVVTILNHD